MTDKTERDELIESLRICAKDCDSYSPDVCGTLIEGIGFIAMRHLLNKAAEALAAPAASDEGKAETYRQGWEAGAASVDVEALREDAKLAFSAGRIVAALRNLSERIRPNVEAAPWVCEEITKLIDSAGGAKCGCGLATCVEPWEPGCGLGTSAEHAVAAGGVNHIADSSKMVPQPAEGDGAVFRGLDSSGRPIYDTHPTVRTTTTDNTRPASTSQVPDDGRWITQTVFYDPAVPHETASGNCTQAAVASILGLPLEQVPDWTGLKANDFWEAFEAFFESRGFDACLKDGSQQPSGMYLASGQSERGCSHMVVMQDGKLLHDPHPSRAGVKSVEHIWLLVPKDPAVAAAPAAPKGEVLYTTEEVAEAMDVLRGRNGSTALIAEAMDAMEQVLTAALAQQEPRHD